MASSLKVTRLQRKGQVTIPIEIREKLGLEEGDLVAFEVTEHGVVIKPQEVVTRDELKRLGSAMQEEGFSLQAYLSFSTSVTERAGKETNTIEPLAEKSVTDQTFGIFESSGQPADFKALRHLFAELMAENATFEASLEQE